MTSINRMNDSRDRLDARYPDDKYLVVEHPHLALVSLATFLAVTQISVRPSATKTENRHGR